MWFPNRGVTKAEKGPYDPCVTASNVDVAVKQSHSMFRLYLLDESHIHCRMYGEPFKDDWLFGLIEAIRPLPYSAAAGKALIDKCDWLDDNPMYRGLKIAQTKSKKVAPATLEVG